MQSLQTRGVNRLVQALLTLSRDWPLLRGVNLGAIATGNTEALLNAKTVESFFPTVLAQPCHVRRVLTALFPVESGHPLIRLGPDSDGGYLVPDDLEGIEACFSPGVSDVCGFELDCAQRGMKVFMADASVDGPPVRHERFAFEKKFLGAVAGDRFMTLESWVEDGKLSVDGDLLLQMDIEGGEYDTLLATSEELLRRFRMIVVECHHLDYLFSEPLCAHFGSTFLKLCATHACVHIHPNNVASTIRRGPIEVPQLAEFTFLRRDRLRATGYVTAFPHPLDRDNTSHRPITLPPACFAPGR